MQMTENELYKRMGSYDLEEVISLLTWLNIKPSFIKEITLDLKKLVKSVDK